MYINEKWTILFSKFLTIVKIKRSTYFLYSQINLISTYYISKKNGIIYRRKIKQSISMKNKGRKDIKSERNFPPRHSHGFIVSVIDSYEYHAFIIRRTREKTRGGSCQFPLLSGIGKNKRETGRKSKVYRRILGRSRFKPDSRGIRVSWRPDIKNGAGSSLRKTVRGPWLPLSLSFSFSSYRSRHLKVERIEEETALRSET